MRIHHIAIGVGLLMTAACKKEEKAPDKAKPGDTGDKGTRDKPKGGGSGEGNRKGGGGGTGGGGGAATAKLELEAVKVESPEAVLEGKVPVGWTKTDLLDTSKSWADPKATMFPSTITLSLDCAGDCSKIADNVTKLVQSQVDSQKASGYDVVVSNQAEVPGGGIEFDMKVSKAGEEPMYQYVRFVYPEGVPSGAQCMVMGVGKDAETTKNNLKEACAAMTVAKK